MEKTQTSPGIQHVAWLYDNIDDMLASWQRVKALGIEPNFCAGRVGSFTFYYTDPDGNLVEMRSDRYKDPERALEMMRSEAMQANPGGVAIDPAKVFEARRSGMSLEELHERAEAGDFKSDAAREYPIPDDQLPASSKKDENA